MALLELIPPENRCPFCFSDDYIRKRAQCADCEEAPPVLNGIAAAFDYVGPAATLVKQIKFGDRPDLAQGCSAYMAMQFLQLGWPLPDYIIPVPIAFTHWLSRGYNQSLLIAQELSKLLHRPVAEPLKRFSGDFSQSGLTRKQRFQLDGSSFQLKDASLLKNKILLLIDDVTTTGSTLRKCGEVLFEASPRAVYGLTICRTEG